jgi:glutamate N-acetyltransferase/amino-acid N-acetyltransferase
MAMKLPEGFQVAGITAGLKHSGRRDLGLILGDAELTWALVSTTNRVFAPCVGRNRAQLASGEGVRALIVNSGNANCANGEQGWLDNERMAEAAAQALGLTPASVLTASTGVVGQRMPIQRIESALTELTAALHDDSAAFAAAIMTTDTTLKQVEVTLPGGARVVGVAKGSGMIHPNMATMLAFVMTDAKLPQNELRDMWRHVTERTFNQITVDGDTSPNDMAFVFSSGLVEAEPADLQAALLEVAGTLARKVARDGEGASKLITVSVTGARSDEEARAAARTVAGSPLVKAAVHGNDPNWGRILVALGRSGASFDQANVSIALQGATVYDGVPHPYDEAAVSDLLKQEDVLISASLGEAAGGSGTAWGCDLTAEYVRINADYTT